MSEVSSRITLTSFVPRQVMLETTTNGAIVASKDDNCKKKRRKDDTVAAMEFEDEKKKSKKNKSSKISNPFEDGSGSAETLAFDRPSSDAISLKGKWREDLLRSIAAFLEGNGFVKTLSVFCSEARIEVNNGGDSCISLEDLFNKFIELSKRDPVACIEWSEEQDVHIKDKKRKTKKVSDSFRQENSEKNCLVATVGAEENTDDGKTLKIEKKKKHKAIACVNIEGMAKEKIEKLNDLSRVPSSERCDFEKDKGEKKEKNEAKQFLELSELSINQKMIADGGSTKHQESVKSDNIVNELPVNVDGNKKEKKKKKNKNLEKSTLDSLHARNSDNLVEEASDGVRKHDDDGLQKFGIRKDSFALTKENNADVETTTNKKRKRSSSKETAIQVENITATGNSKETKPDVSKEEMETRDRKVVTCNEPLPLNRESKEPCQFTADKNEENANLQDPSKQWSGHQLANGGLEKHQKESSTRQKSMRKDKHSGEPKVLNAFQRVKVDEVQFADERLQDNSYWALDDSGSGYGAKAQEVLGQVRGRDFRHEKTKKKRGAYRGGQIDLEAHSIKFNYSDDE